jgi:hypothetical protein
VRNRSHPDNRRIPFGQSPGRRFRLRTTAAAVVLLGLSPAVTACAGGGLGGLSTANQVIVHLDQNPNDLAAAQRVADAQCGRTGGRARFLARISNDGGSHDVRDPQPPDAVFACDPPSAPR